MTSFLVNLCESDVLSFPAGWCDGGKRDLGAATKFVAAPSDSAT